MPTKKNSLPSRQQGVSERGNIRTRKLAAPRCPISEEEFQVLRDGSLRPDPNYRPGEVNCQREADGAAGWWLKCEERGHEPYWTIKKRTVDEEVVDDNEFLEDGKTPNPNFGVVTGVKKRLVVTKTLNVNQVPVSTRFGSGRMERYSKVAKGRKDLGEFGFNEKCEYRNCELDVKLQSKYGAFCSERHARLIGVDVEGEPYPVRRNELNKTLASINIEYEGAYVLQLPPDLEGGTGL